MCHADSLHPSPSIVPHLPQMMPLLSSKPSSSIFHLSICAPACVLEKREKRSRWDQGTVPENSLNRTYHIRFLAWRGMHVKSLPETGFSTLKKTCCKVFNVPQTSASKIQFYKREKTCFSIFDRKSGFLLWISRAKLFSLFSLETQESRILEKTAAAQIWEKNFFKPAHGDQRPLARQVLLQEKDWDAAPES